MKYFKNIIKQTIGNHSLIVKNSLFLGIIEFFRIVLPFISIPYLISTIGGDYYGRVIFYQTVVVYFVAFINWGLNISEIKSISENRDNDEKINEIISSVFLLKFLLWVITLIIALALVFFVKKFESNYLIFSFAFLTTIAEVFSPIWYFVGIEKMKYLTVTQTISIILYNAAIFIFIRSQQDYVYLPLIYSFGNILTTLLSLLLLFLKEKRRLYIVTFNNILTIFKNSFPFFLSRVSEIFNNSIAKLLLGLSSDMRLVAAFELAQKISSVSIIPMSVINKTIYPRLSFTKSKSDATKYLKFLIVFSLFISIVLFIFSPNIISFFSKKELLEAVGILRILSVYSFVVSLSTFMGSSILLSFGFKQIFNKSVIYSTIVSLIIYSIIYYFRYVNVHFLAIQFIVYEFIVLMIRFYYCVKYDLLSFKFHAKD